MLYDYCASHSVPFKKCGKIIVATNQTQLESDLPSITEKAKRNGVKDLKMLSEEDVGFLEPEVQCTGAILSPSTGIFDSHSFMLNLLGDAENDGASIAFQSEVEGGTVLRRSGGGGILLHVEGMDLLCDKVVNCAGLFADKIANLILNGKRLPSFEQGRLPLETEGNDLPLSAAVSLQRQFFAKGNYFRLEKKTPFSHLVYPVPEVGGLGIHATFDLSGSTRFGPDVEWIDMGVTNPDEIDMTVDASRALGFYDAIRKYWPKLKDGTLAPDYAGVRPKIGHPGLKSGPSVKADFVIQGPKDHGVDGFVTMLAMESPGLTSSLAIADLVLQMVDGNSKSDSIKP